jgi:hypothetical protein
MKFWRLSGWLSGLLVLSLVIGCGDDDDDSTTGPGPQGPPDVAMNEITVPSGLENVQDPMAQQALQYILGANSFTNWASYFDPDKKSVGAALDGPPWTETWTENGLTITMTIDEDESGYYWDIVLDGTDGEYEYDEFLFIESWQTTDGTTGEMLIYDPETQTGDELFSWAWDTASDGTYTLEMADYDAGEKIVIIINPDGSGSLDYYYWDDVEEEWVLSFGFSWDADGDGEWTEYNEDGSVADSGDWEGEGGEPSGDLPELDFDTVDLPAAMLESEDMYAQWAVSYVQMANDLSSLIYMYFTPEGDIGKAPSFDDGPPWVYTWTEEGVTFTLTVDETADTYTWTVIMDGNDGYDDYDNFLAAEAEEAQDGSWGSVTIYDPETEEADTEWNWYTEGTTYFFTLTSYDDEYGDMEIFIAVESDGSGTIEEYSDGELVMMWEWAADGTGEWWQYYEGSQVASGSWAK